MSEIMRQENPDAEQLRASLLAEHGDRQMMLNGAAMSFKDYVAIGELLCPVPAEQRSPEANLRRLAGDLVKADVQLDEKYASYIPELPKEAAAPQKNEAKQEKKIEPAKESPVKVERAVEAPKAVQVVDKEAPLLVTATEITEKAETPKPAVVVPKEVMTQTVVLETVAATYDAHERENIIQAEVQNETPVILEEIISVEPAPVQERMEIVATTEPVEASLIEQDFTAILPEEVQPAPEQVKFLSLEPDLESELSVMSEAELGGEQEYRMVPEDTVFDIRAILSSDVEISSVETLEVASESAPESDVMFDLAAVEPASETLVQSPKAVVEEFIAQVLPVEVVTEVVAERLITMEPEAAAEIASQIEMIVIVADRLHELVVTGATEGEEAKQIEAFLKREYEQVLLAIGVEPTQEILEKFIAYIYAADYQLQVGAVQNYIEVSDEGTHEKKLFDEQSVFTKAQLASAGLSKKLGNSIGHILITNLAA